MIKAYIKIMKYCIPCIFFLSTIVLWGVYGGQACAEDGAVKPESVSICIGGAPGIPVLLAHEQGLFSREGIEVILKKYRTGGEGFEGLLREECDMSSVAETPIVMKSFDRQDFSIVATYSTSDNSPRILASRKSGIKTPQDLKGKRILVLKFSSNYFFLNMFLAKNGLSGNDVTLIFSDVPDVSEAFRNGTIDAFCGTEVLIDKPLKALGNDAVVFDSPGLCVVSFHLTTMNKFIKTKPDVVKKIIAALLKNEEVIKKDHSRAVKTAAAALNMEEKVVETMWDNYKWKVELSQSMLLSLEQEAQWAIESGLTNKSHIPNYLDFIYRDALQALKPEAVTILK